MTEIPEFLWERSSNAKWRLLPETRITEFEADTHEIVETDITALPAECQDCVFRPANSGGNNGCFKIQETLDQLQSAGNFLRSGRLDTLNEALRLENHDAQDFYTTGGELFTLYNSMIEALSGPHIGTPKVYEKNTFQDPNPAPYGDEVTVCFKGLSNFAGDNVASSVAGIIDFAKTIDTAISKGLKTPE